MLEHLGILMLQDDRLQKAGILKKVAEICGWDNITGLALSYVDIHNGLSWFTGYSAASLQREMSDCSINITLVHTCHTVSSTQEVKTATSRNLRGQL